MMKSLILATCLGAASLTACASYTGSEPTLSETGAAETQFVSNADFATTNDRLKAAIETRGLTLFTIVDHAAGAAKVDQTLAPNTLYIFGNPKAGTPLMQANPALGLDLPLKAQVREEDGRVLVTVSDIRAITATAGVSTPAQVIDNIEDALTAIGLEAAGGRKVRDI